MTISIDGIRTKQIFFVPMLARRLTLAESNTFDNLTEDHFNELQANPEQIDFQNQDVKFHISKTDHDETMHVKIRLLYRHQVPVNFKTRKVIQKKPLKAIDKAIIHFHGGGFVAMDSASHQNYTRKWANELGVPVFSIDYRLAPKYPYPDFVNDCYQAYVWIVT